MGNWAPETVNLSKGKVIDGGYTPLPDGPYHCKIMDSERAVNAKSGKNNFTFEVSVLDGECAGMTTKLTVGGDFNKDGNQHAMVTTLASIGIDPAVLGQEVTIKPSTFEGKECYIIYKNKAEGDTQGFDDRKFITRERYETLTKAGAVVAGGKSNGTGKGLQAPQPSNASSALKAALSL